MKILIAKSVNEANVKRFWSKVKIRGDDDCWEWQASTASIGYGQFFLRWDKALKKKLLVGAHRFSLTVKLGREILPGYEALHECDNPRCVNPKHLWEGTQGDNARDTTAKGKNVGNRTNSRDRGEKHANAKLTDDKVREIKRLWKTGGYSQGVLSKMFGVSQSLISHIINGKAWSHVK